MHGGSICDVRRWPGRLGLEASDILPGAESLKTNVWSHPGYAYGAPLMDVLGQAVARPIRVTALVLDHSN